MKGYERAVYKEQTLIEFKRNPLIWELAKDDLPLNKIAPLM